MTTILIAAIVGVVAWGWGYSYGKRTMLNLIDSPRGACQAETSPEERRTKHLPAS
jgi:hypothetical protein